MEEKYKFGLIFCDFSAFFVTLYRLSDKKKEEKPTDMQ